MGRRKRRDEAPLSLFSFQDIMACLTGVLILITLILSLDGLSDRPTTSAQSGAAAAAEAAALREELAVLRKVQSDATGGTDLADRDIDVLDERVAQLARDAERTRAAIERAQSALREEDVRVRDLDARAEALRRQSTDQRRSAQQAALRARIELRPGARRRREPVFVEVMPDRLRFGELTADAVPELRSEAPDAAGAMDMAAFERVLATHPPDRNSVNFVVHEGAVARFRRLLDRVSGPYAEAMGWGPWAGPGSIFDPPQGGAP
jgi:hypothetical protein